MRLLGEPAFLTILSAPDLLIVALVFVLLFGGKKIPELAKGLGQSIRNFKGEVKGEEEAEAKRDTTRLS